MDKVTKSAGKKPPLKGGSRKGIPNKNTAELKAMILEALEKAGGVEYLLKRAKDPKTAVAFLTLIGKVLPMTVAGDPDAPVHLTITRRIVKPE